MTPKRFMQLIERGKAAAIEHAEPRMVSAYRAALRAAGRRASAAFTEHAHPLTASANPPTFGEPDPDEVLDIRLLLLEAQERAKPGRKAALRHVVSQVLSEGGIAFDIGGVFATELLDAAGRRVSSELGRSARAAVVDAIEHASSEGLSIPQAAESIQAAVYGIADYTATMLARTDLIGIANGGSIGAARQIFGETSGIMKTWLATEDERTRESHAEADGQQVPMEHPFQVGDDELDYPGDPSGSDEAVCNCRCTLTIEESAGALTAAAVDFSSGSMVAVYPTRSEADALAVVGGQPVEDLHCTLAFLPDGLDDAQLFQRALGELAAVAAATTPLEGTVGGVGAFTEGPDGVPMIVLPDVVGLDRLRVAVIGALEAAGVNYAANHGFCPHITLDYTTASAAASLGPFEGKPGLPLTFAAVTLMRGTQRTDLPLAGKEAPMSTVIDEDLTAATVITITQDGETPAASAAPANWVSDVAFEGTATSDGRYILPDALTWRDPPLTLMALIETGPGGHEGAEAAGRMDTFQKDSAYDMNGDQLPTGVVAVRSTGIFDMEGEYGAEIARMVDEQIITGVSVDLAILDWCFRDPATGQLLEPADMSEADWERAFYDELQFAVRKAEILATTVCPTPAFADASIALTASSPPRRQEGAIRMTLFSPIQSAPDPADALTASAAGAAPDFPPRDWFSIPEADVPTPLTVDDDGRVFGHLAVWGTCHTGNPRGFGVCTQPPRNSSGYSMFHLGKVRTAEGEDLAVGQITLSENGAGHAAYGLKPDAVTRHYDDTGTAMADIRAVDGKLGIWVSGALRPDATMGQIREMRGGKLSGDWRKVQGRTELMGALLVNVPGFPVPQAQAVLASAAGGEDVLALTAAGIVGVLDPAEAEMRIQVLGARALGGIHGLAALARS